MKVLILGSKEYPFGVSDDILPSGGMETYVQELAKHLVRQKIKPIVVTRKFDLLKPVENKEGVDIHRVNWVRGFWLRGPSFNFFSFIRSLDLDFDIILTNGLPSTFFGHILSKLKKRPLVAIPHGTAHNQDKYGLVARKVAYWLEKSLYSNANLILLSDEEARRFKSDFNIEKPTIIPTPVDIQTFKFKRKNAKIPIITFVGRLAEVKGVKYLLEAVPLLKGDFKIRIVGSGHDEAKLKAQAKELNIESNVEFTGLRLDVDDILSKTDIFVLPSLSEGLPISLLEAMASGCACVVTDIGLPVTDGKNALVVPARDSEKLAEAIDELIKSKPLRAKLGQNARTYVEQFSWESASKQFKQLFESLS